MFKETSIVILIIVFIVIMNAITQNYTKNSVDTMSGKLLDIRQILISDNQNRDELLKKVDDVESTWESIHDKLAYYIEHNELESVETDLKGIKSNIETEEYTHTISDLDKCVFLLEHIEDKEKLNLKNIF